MKTIFRSFPSLSVFYDDIVTFTFEKLKMYTSKLNYSLNITRGQNIQQPNDSTPNYINLMSMICTSNIKKRSLIKLNKNFPKNIFKRPYIYENLTSVQLLAGYLYKDLPQLITSGFNIFE